MVKYKINDLYRAKLTKVEVPEYATASHFIRQSNKEFIFVIVESSVISIISIINFNKSFLLNIKNFILFILLLVFK